MYHFFTDTELFADTDVTITGPDVNHIKNVLRMKPGERVLVSDGKGLNRFCEIEEIGADLVRAKILEDQVKNTELPVRVTLYQGLPKADKMELIIQKCVELGVFRIVPVSMSRCVVKLDAKKEAAKIKRWEGISESAAKQSKRLIVPEISGVMSFKEAVEEAKSADCAIVPYEDSESLSGAGGMKKTRTLIAGMKPGSTCAVFIGPEGGFSPEEIELAMKNGVQPVTLGNRILRTETAGIFVMAAVGFMTEE
ncbi:MAG: 16S rRNA (uracil(1498)-N(3))-methyltransferase [Lachnospiraceae bacterium]|nr:16S rRNA (uracil(1498)-N(3))-methyltransferase [Lachnospiraceae bacterium]